MMFYVRLTLFEKGKFLGSLRASALNIIINAISVWNTVYLSKATELFQNKGTLRGDLLKHISPLGWEHINFLMEYTFIKS